MATDKGRRANRGGGVRDRYARARGSVSEAQGAVVRAFDRGLDAREGLLCHVCILAVVALLDRRLTCLTSVRDHCLSARLACGGAIGAEAVGSRQNLVIDEKDMESSEACSVLRRIGPGWA